MDKFVVKSRAEFVALCRALSGLLKSDGFFTREDVKDLLGINVIYIYDRLGWYNLAIYAIESPDGSIEITFVEPATLL